MSNTFSASFAAPSISETGTLILLVDAKGAVASTAKDAADQAGVEKAIAAASFKGGLGKSLELLLPGVGELDRIVLVGTGKGEDRDEHSWLKIGGRIAALASGRKDVSVLAVAPGEDDSISINQVAAMALGAKLAHYRFDRYKTSKGTDDEEKAEEDNKGDLELRFLCDDADKAAKEWKSVSGVGDGVLLARDLVNEPANVLTPKEFAKRAKALEELGCEVTVLKEKDMQALKMRALLGVAQGSRNAPRMALIEWNGGKKSEKPVAFIGKGVTFDTGGISIKPSGGMEDMKGDMGGAAAVTGLMHALAARKAKANVVGVIALVENMPDGNAQRPGDIVKSMSGQTIEILNTDAEGRLVLADALWHCREKYDPKFMINLATLTGAILVALGNHHAGLFSNDDDLSEQLRKAGLATQEKVWRMPLGPEYDKLIDSKNADMKNIGGRYAGSITAGQFLQRFVEKTPWAHLDVAGTAMGSPKTEINQSWASGFGVRLLDRLVADNYES